MTTQRSLRASTRREFIRGSLLATAAVSVLGQEAFAVETPQRKPNIIVINADDLGYGDLRCYGSKVINTPNLDKLARSGVRFTDFYSGAPVCTPSRAALMTGRYPIRSGCTWVFFPNEKTGMPDNEITVGQMLQKQGYATACIGKWHLGHLPRYLPTRHGFDYYYGLPYSNDMGGMKDGYPDVPLIRNEETIERPAHLDLLTQRYTQETIKFAKEHKNQPFFIYLAHTMPHKPLYVSEKFRGRSKHGLYGDVVEEIDHNIGVLMRSLKEEGLDKNTLVIFTSDNGPVIARGGSAGPLSGQKGSVWEGGMREPFIACWPGHIPAGRICRQPASVLDMLPTFANLAGTKAPSDRIIDGRDITKLLTCKGKLPDYAMFYDVTRPGVPAMRYGKWKMRMEAGRKTLKDVQLHNLDLDIGERMNVAKQHPEIVADMLKRLEEFQKTLPTTSQD